MDALAYIVLILVVILLVAVGPLLTIWALNTLFALNIAYTFHTWLAAFVLQSTVYGLTGNKKEG